MQLHPIRTLAGLAVLLAVAIIWGQLPAAPAAAQDTSPVPPDVSDGTFPKPPALYPRVAFWKRIYTEVGTDGGLIHDSRDIAVVYEVLRLPKGLSSRSRERKIRARKRHFEKLLLGLAGGRRTGLSVEERRVLGLFPEGVSNTTLRAASRQLRFQLGQANKFRDGVARMGRWEDYIKEVLLERQLPLGLVALPHVESSYNPDAYSHAGASGLWQFTRGTGRMFMRVDHVVDERRDPWIASVAAARLLAGNYEKTRTWPLAITAYNHGTSGMMRAVRKLGTRDIETVLDRYKSRTFGFASRNFYLSFLAALEVETDPERYFGPITKDAPLRPEIVPLDHYYKASTLAEVLGLPLADLKKHNRALLSPVWSGQKLVPRGYGLRVPASPERAAPRAMLAGVPQGLRFDEQLPDRYYRVKRGDSLSRIARRFKVRESELVALNGLRSRHHIRAGQRLRLPVKDAPRAVARVESPGRVPEPAPADGLYRVRRGDTLDGIAQRFGIGARDLAAANGIRNRNRIHVGQVLTLPGGGTSATAGGPAGVYVVRRGDTLEAIARRFGTTTQALVRHNGLGRPDRIHPGQRIYIPGGSSTPRSDAGDTRSTTEEARNGGPGPAALAPVDAAPPPVARALPSAPDRLPLDPDRYRVGMDGTAIVQPGESLGLLAQWLNTSASELRRLNGFSSSRTRLGARIRLDLSRVSRKRFESRRRAHHQQVQQGFYDRYAVDGARDVTIGPGDTLSSVLAAETALPLWLLLATNPELDPNRLRPGQRVRVPEVVPRG